MSTKLFGAALFTLSCSVIACSGSAEPTFDEGNTQVISGSERGGHTAQQPTGQACDAQKVAASDPRFYTECGAPNAIQCPEGQFFSNPDQSCVVRQACGAGEKGLRTASSDEHFYYECNGYYWSDALSCPNGQTFSKSQLVCAAPVQANTCNDPIGTLFLVDKQHSLPSTYAPTDLVWEGARAYRSPIQGALNDMRAAATSAGVPLTITSAYRSYSDQASTFAYWVQVEKDKASAAGETLSQAEAEARANRSSAYPGQSEHQLGVTFDFNYVDTGDDATFGNSFGASARGQWLAAHAHEFGFVMSYPQGKEASTGYMFEPWHFRWVGKDISIDLKSLGYLNASSSWTLGKYLTDRCGK